MQRNSSKSHKIFKMTISILWQSVFSRISFCVSRNNAPNVSYAWKRLYSVNMVYVIIVKVASAICPQKSVFCDFPSRRYCLLSLNNTSSGGVCLPTVLCGFGSLSPARTFVEPPPARSRHHVMRHSRTAHRKIGAKIFGYNMDII